MILLSVLLLTVCPVRYFFPAIARQGKKALEEDVQKPSARGGPVYAAPRHIPSMTYAKQDGMRTEVVAVDGRV